MSTAALLLAAPTPATAEPADAGAARVMAADGGAASRTPHGREREEFGQPAYHAHDGAGGQRLDALRLHGRDSVRAGIESPGAAPGLATDVLDQVADGAAGAREQLAGIAMHRAGKVLAVVSTVSNHIDGGIVSSDRNTAAPVVLGELGKTDVLVTRYVLTDDRTDVESVSEIFLGGSGDDIPTSVAFGRDGRLVIAGYTASTDYPVTGHALLGNHGNVPKDPASGSPGTQTHLHSKAATATGTYEQSCDNPQDPTKPYDVTYDGFLTVLEPSAPATANNPLPIPDVIAYSTYFGGLGADEIHAVTVTDGAEILVAGRTNSIDLPVTDDAVQRKLAGHSLDNCTTAIPADGFVAAFEPDAVDRFRCAEEEEEEPLCGRRIPYGLRFATYLGGTGLDALTAVDYDYRRYAQTGVPGAIFVAGFTMSADYPTRKIEKPGFTHPPDAVLSVLDWTGTRLLASVQFGGSRSDYAESVVVDDRGRAVVAGSLGIPDKYDSLDELMRPSPARENLRGTVGGANDAFVTRFDIPAILAGHASGRPDYATFLGTRGHDRHHDIGLDHAGSVHVLGYLAKDPGDGESGDSGRTVSPSAQAGSAGVLALYDGHYHARLSVDGSLDDLDALDGEILAGTGASPGSRLVRTSMAVNVFGEVFVAGQYLSTTPGSGFETGRMLARLTRGSSRQPPRIISTPPVDRHYANANEETGRALATAMPGRRFQYVLETDTPVHQRVHYSVHPLPLPGNAVFDYDRGVFTFTPDAGDWGIYPLQFVVSDGENFSTQEVDLVVFEETGPSVYGQDVYRDLVRYHASGWPRMTATEVYSDTPGERVRVPQDPANGGDPWGRVQVHLHPESRLPTSDPGGPGPWNFRWPASGRPLTGNFLCEIDLGLSVMRHRPEGYPFTMPRAWITEPPRSTLVHVAPGNLGEGESESPDEGAAESLRSTSHLLYYDPGRIRLREGLCQESS